MGFVHQLTDLFVVAFVQGITYGQYAVLLAEYELGAAVVLLADFGLHFLQLFPCAVAQGLKLSFRMLGCNVLDNVLA